MTRGACAMVAFRGRVVDSSIARLVADPRVAGVTLYRSLNVDTLEQTRQLTADLQRAAGRPLLVGVDQEGGQLIGAGADTTHFAGNMALGAVGDGELTRRVGAAIGTELRALGINVDYAPVADVASRPGNPSLGIRSFGESPKLVAEMTAATVQGLQQSGVAATLKHFPGKGEASVDPHFELPVLDMDRGRLDEVEFAPFRAGIAAGARLVMVGHYGLPAVIGDRTTPASLSSEVLSGLLRTELGFEGLVITDALDMGGFGEFAPDLPLKAGADLLLYGPAQAAKLPSEGGTDAAGLDDLLDWLANFPQPDLDVVRCREHTDLAEELASRALTLVKDDAGALPLRPRPSDRILAVMPRPADLTPADTSSLVEPVMAAAIRRHHIATTEIVTSARPKPAEISAAAAAAVEHEVTIVGTIDAEAEQAELVAALLRSSRSVVTVALRTPYDLAQYSAAPTYLCTYGIHPPSMNALAAALFGHQPVRGRLPVGIPDHYPAGHGIRSEVR